MASTKTRLKTPWKSRVAFVHGEGSEAIFLLVHPCGELLLVSNSDRPSGAARWENACVLWVEEREEYWMCKYGTHDKKFALPNFDEAQLTSLSIDLGIEFRSKGKRRVETPMMLESLMGRSLLNWIIKHPKMAKENATVMYYREHMTKAGISPLPDAEYTGY